LLATLAILEGGPVAAGLWSGLCVFANPVSLPSLAVMGKPRGARFLAAASVLALAVCVPWIIRNWVVMGAPYFIRDNFGLELYISNNDRAGADLAANSALFTMHPNQNPNERAVLAAMGETAYYRMRLRDALDWIRTHPWAFLRLSAQRVLYYWWPPRAEGWQAYSYWIVSALSAAGIYLARRNRAAVLLTIAMVAYSLPFVVIQTVGRYRFPSLWMSALLGGYAITALLDRRKHVA